MKKNLWKFLFSIVVALSLTCTIQAWEDMSINPSCMLFEECVEYLDVSELNVEIYVTDGYNPISGATVELAGNELETNDYGKALFFNIPVKNELYDIHVSSPIFGDKNVQLQIPNKIVKGSQPLCKFTVSFWTAEQTRLDNQHVDSLNQQRFELNTTDSVAYNINSDGWVNSSNMSTGLTFETSVLHDGNIYVIGGINPATNKFNCGIRIYNIATDTWTDGSDIGDEYPISKTDARAVISDDKIYFIGGSTVGNPNSSGHPQLIFEPLRLDIYDIANDSWIVGQSLPVKSQTSYYTMLQNKLPLYNKKIYMPVENPETKYVDFYSYDLSSNQWAYEEDMVFPHLFSLFSVTLYNDKLYVISSETKYGPANKLSIYDFNQKSWTYGPDLLCGIDSCYDPYIDDGKIYVVSSSLQGDVHEWKTSTQIYDINKNEWKEGASTERLINFRTLLYDNKIYLIGGNNPNETDPDTVYDRLHFRVYDIIKDKWSKGPYLNQTRSYFVNIFAYNNNLYVMGGNGAARCGDIYTIIPEDKITAVDNLPDISVKYQTSVENVVGILQKTYPYVSVTLNGGSSTCELPVIWELSSTYDSTLVGTPQIFYGKISDIPDGISNSRRLSASVNVVVEKGINILEIVPITITADQSIPLERDGMEHMFGVPVTVPVPKTVEVKLDNGTTVSMDVKWDIAAYDPQKTGEQTILGEVELPSGISNKDKITAKLNITVIPTEYEVIDADPKTISVTVLAGTTKDEIHAIVDRKIDVDVINAETSEEVYIYSNFTFSDDYAENTSFNPNQLGVQTLIGRFDSNFLDTVEQPYVEVEVSIVASEIISVADQHVDAYQCVEFAKIDNLPAKATVTLENGMMADVDVEWNASSYDKNIAGDQLITGNLVNLKAGIIQPDEERTAILIVHNQPVNYKVAAITQNNDFFDMDKDGNELYAGFTLNELREKLPIDKVKVRLESITPGIKIDIADYDMDFTLDEENNPSYVPEEEFVDNLYGTLVLSDNISNPDGLMYEFTVQTNPVEIDELEPVSVIVEYYTAFNDIDLPDTVYAKLSNGQRKAINVNWGNGNGYDPDPAGLTEDNPVAFDLNGELCDIPQYINHYDTDIPQLTITLVLPRVYKITGVSPARLPETGATKINLGSSLSEIYDLLESHTATVTLENLKGVQSTQNITFTLREADNMHYDAMSESEVELIAYFNLPEGVENPDNLQMVICVLPTRYTIRTTVAARVNGVLKGTAFDDVEMPDKVTVNYTDTVVKQGEVPVASWDGSKYDSNKLGNQAIKGTFPNPLPAYVVNPNNRTPSAIVNVVDPTVTMLSAKQVSNVNPSLKKAISKVEMIDGFIERKYEVKLLNLDGSITTEIISIFDTIE